MKLQRATSWVFACTVLFYLLVPLIVVIPVSLTNGQIAHFPPEGLSLRWYRDFFNDPYWMAATRLSFELRHRRCRRLDAAWIDHQPGTDTLRVENRGLVGSGYWC